VDARDRLRIAAACVVGFALVAVILAISLLGLLVSECLGAADCSRDNDRRTIVILAAPLVAATVLIAGTAAATRAERARPVLIAIVVMVAVYFLWWSLDGWSTLVFAALVTAAAIGVTVRSFRSTTVTRGTPPRP
jgi:uncharacterized membrane protein